MKLKKNTPNLQICLRSSILLLTILLFSAIFSADAMAQTLTVTNTNDSGTGSLRQAIIDAHAFLGDTIEFQSPLFDTPQTITLTSGELSISVILTINGPGADKLTISGNNTSRVFNMSGSVTRVEINDITIANGETSQDGGGIYNEGFRLTISNSAIIGNSARNGGGIYSDGFLIKTIITNSTINGNSATLGGGIHSAGANETTITNSIINGNSGGSGGGIFRVGTNETTITNSTISGNSATFGGGIYNISENITTITNSTISGNSVNVTFGGSRGGGIYSASPLSIINSTISENSASAFFDSQGGGIYMSPALVTAGSLTIENSTVNRNSAIEGGGIYIGGITTVLKNTIIANSLSGGDCIRTNLPGAIINAEFSLIGDGLDCVDGTTSNNLTGDPKLGPLQDNGGSTLTHALLPGSRVINRGSNTLIPFNVTTDQRGAARIADSVVDMGSFELGIGSAILVSKTADTNDFPCDFSDCSLREAIDLANSRSADDRIEFLIPPSDPNCVNGVCTITLSNGELNIADNGSLTINGTGKNNLIVSGNNAGRVVDIYSGADATINALTITDGTSASGGGIANSGNLTLNDAVIKDSSATFGAGGGIATFTNQSQLTLNNSTVTNNSATSGGGGITNSGTATINNSTINGNSNSSGGSGGGIYALQNSSITINNSTISGNQANGSRGGGIAVISDSTANLNNVTVSNNSTDTFGGGIYITGAASVANLKNTILGNNSGGDCSRFGGTVNAEFSLISIGLTSCVNGTESNNLTGSAGLAPLGDYGGSTLTHALLQNSQAIDPMSSIAAPATDQRGVARVNSADLGAFEANNTVVVDLPNGQTNVAYDYQIAADSGGFIYSVTGGSLPNGLMLTPSSSVLGTTTGISLSGTPTQGGTFNFSITASSSTSLLGSNSNVTNYQLVVFAPTAAGVEISGRVLSPNGRGVPGVTVHMTDQSGSVHIARTNQFGYYKFENIEVGQTLVFNVFSKRYQFTTQIVNLNDSITNLNFIAQDSKTKRRFTERFGYLNQR